MANGELKGRRFLLGGTIIEKKTLTVGITGATAPFTVSIDGEDKTGTSFQYPIGTLLSIVEVKKVGYTSIPQTNITMDVDKTLTFPLTAIAIRTLTVNITGTTGATIKINGVVRTGTTFQFNDGETVASVEISKDGFTFAPSSFTNILMDADKSISSTATAIPQRSLTISVSGTTDYITKINGVVVTGTVFTYNEGTILDSVELSKVGFTFEPRFITNVVMDQNRTFTSVATEAIFDPNYLEDFDRLDLNHFIVGVTTVVGDTYTCSGDDFGTISGMKIPIGGEIAVKWTNTTNVGLSVSSVNIFDWWPHEGAWLSDDPNSLENWYFGSEYETVEPKEVGVWISVYRLDLHQIQIKKYTSIGAVPTIVSTFYLNNQLQLPNLFFYFSTGGGGEYSYPQGKGLIIE